MKQRYVYPVLLLLSIILGGLFGHYCGEWISYLTPIAEIFLNLIFTTVVPLIFFSVAASMTKFKTGEELSRTLLRFFGGLVGLAAVAAIVMLGFVMMFPVHPTVKLPQLSNVASTPVNFLSKLPSLLTVPQIGQLFSTEHMLPLILFAMLLGLSAKRIDKSGHFIAWLSSAEQVFVQIFAWIMRAAPLGFFAYFAGIVHQLGPQILDSYLQVSILYYVVSLMYLGIVFTAYVYFFGGSPRLFWSKAWLPGLTALATCSSAAAIPPNVEAVKQLGLPSATAETLIPLGTVLHKQGSIMGAVVKIAFLFALFHIPMSGFLTLFSLVVIAMIMGTVMGAIPSGGMLGELFILSVYGFPTSALFLIATISIIIDPPATLLNVLGNTLAGWLSIRMKSNPAASGDAAKVTGLLQPQAASQRRA